MISQKETAEKKLVVPWAYHKLHLQLRPKEKKQHTKPLALVSKGVSHDMCNYFLYICHCKNEFYFGYFSLKIEQRYISMKYC